MLASCRQISARRVQRFGAWLLVGWLALGLGACGPGPAAAPKPAPAAPAQSAGAAASSASGAPAAPSEVPERDTLSVAIAAGGSTSLPLQVAQDAGYFRNHGLTVNISVVAASVAVQGLVSRSIDIYQGGAAAIAGRLGGADIIYVGAAVDKSTLKLFGQQGVTAFPDFRGKAIATTSAGAFGEIALHQTAKEFGMVPGTDFELRYHPGPAAAATTFTSGGTAGVIITPPQSTLLGEQGYPLIMDYQARGLKIIGPGSAVLRDLVREAPNTVRAYMRAYLDGLKRALDDPAYAIALNAKISEIGDADEALRDYEIGRQVWNKDMTIDRTAIEVVLQNSPLPNARTANPEEFYDNTLVQQVNATYGSRLFPDAIPAR